MLRVAVIGPGAIGATVAAWLAQSPAHEVLVCARTPFDGIEVETSSGVLRATPRVLTDPAEAKPVDWALVATKAYDTDGAAAWLRRLVGPDTRVAVLQNGVEHVARFAPYVDAARITPVVVYLPAERSAPGRIRQRRSGELVAPDDPGGRAFAALFEGTLITASVSEDFVTEIWRKLALNAAGAVCALTLQPAGIVRFPPAAELMRAIVREAIAVGRVQGATLDDGLVETVIERMLRGPADAVNSLLADRQAGRPMEVDARNGAVVRFGRAAGLETPVNAMTAAILEAAAQPPPR